MALIMKRWLFVFLVTVSVIIGIGTHFAFAQEDCEREIPILRTISNPYFSYTYNSEKSLFIEIRDAKIFKQLGLKDEPVDFSTEEVLILGFNEIMSSECHILQVNNLFLCQGKIVIKKEVIKPESFMHCHDTGHYSVITLVIPRQEKALPGFQTTLPVKGGFYSQYYYYSGLNNIDIEDVKHKMKSAGIRKEGNDRFSSRRYEAISYVRFSGSKSPSAIGHRYPYGKNGAVIGAVASTFSGWDIKLPEMEPEEAAKHLAQSLILPLFDVSEKDALVFAAECLDNGGWYTFRPDWPMPERFNQERFREANDLPQKSDFSVFRRSDINDNYNIFTESSSLAHLRIYLAHVSFRRQVPGIAEYFIHIAEHGRMFIQIINLEKPLSMDELWQGFEKALQGLVDGDLDKKRFNPIYGYADRDPLIHIIQP